LKVSSSFENHFLLDTIVFVMNLYRTNRAIADHKY